MLRFNYLFWLLIAILYNGQLYAQTITKPAQNIATTSGVLSQPKRYKHSIGYLGIPYAKPPIKQRRWQKPAALYAPQQELTTDKFANACYQDNYNVDWYKDVALAFDHQLTMAMPVVSEDCLYLNIWLPNKPTTSKRAVMVWIHGGSNKAGWSYEPNYLGHVLAAQGDVIVVSIAYRLGVFGFLAHPQLNSQTDKTNFALLDQLHALRWIKDNISAFGGDPQQVTIMGESAGAADIAYLMAAKQSAGLFSQAISQSAGFQWIADASLDTAQQTGASLSKHLNANIQQLKQLPSDTIWQAFKTIAPDYDYRALIDDNLFKQSPLQAFAANAQVNLLIGSNKDEFYMYQAEDIQQPTLPLTPKSKVTKDKLLAIYHSFTDKKSAQDWLDTFLYMSCPSMLMADIISKKDQLNAYLYRFDQVRTGGEKLKAYHGAEIPYMFNRHDAWLPTSKQDIQLTDYMITAWTNFAKFGDPNGKTKPLSPHWPAYNSASQQMITLSEQPMSVVDPNASLCQSLWQDYYTSQPQ